MSVRKIANLVDPRTVLPTDALARINETCKARCPGRFLFCDFPPGHEGSHHAYDAKSEPEHPHNVRWGPEISPPRIVHRCRVCAREADPANLRGVMAIAYPYTPDVGTDLELVYVCGLCAPDAMRAIDELPKPAEGHTARR